MTEECLMAWGRPKLYRDTKGWKAGMAELYCNTPRCIVTRRERKRCHDTIVCIVTGEAC